MSKGKLANDMARADIRRRTAQTHRCKVCGKNLDATPGESYSHSLPGHPKEDTMCTQDATTVYLKRLPIPPGWSIVEEAGMYPMLTKDNKQVHIEVPFNEVWGIDETFEDDNPVVRFKMPYVPASIAQKMLRATRMM
jgi:hypothetical protein